MKPMKTLSLAAALLLGTSAFAFAASGWTGGGTAMSHGATGTYGSTGTSGAMGKSMANGTGRSAILSDLHGAGYTHVLSLMKDGPMYVATADKGSQRYSVAVNPKTGKISPSRLD